MKRRNFLRKASQAGIGITAGIGTAGLLTACQGESAEEAITTSTDCQAATETIHWKMVTTWPRDFPALGTGANTLAESITRISGGRIQVKVYGGGELVPPFEIFDAVSSGTAQMGHGAPYYWKGKIPAAQYFAGVPFGFTAREQNAWLYYGGGLDLWRELYAPHNLRPYPTGNTGVQMGGWFNKEINSLADLKGLKMRIPGLGGEVLKRAGGTPVNIPGAELFTALQTGTIDATEWVGPYNDLAFGLFRAAKYYYTPGWHEPGTTLEAFVNQKAYAALPEDLQHCVDIACQAANLDMLSEFTARNGKALTTLIQKHQVELRQFPEEVIAKLKQMTTEVLADLANADADSARVYASWQAFSKQVKGWTDVSELAYLKARG
ncbi:MAG: TRAP transporter substrate-binding protein DctP [Xanthomonadales bacterium]|nr:TRAP transporter substrate-binding protein DctP [Xanthomonadales bacterium]